MSNIAINLYTVRALDEPMAAILGRIATAGYDGVQFSGGFRDATPTEVESKLSDLDLVATAVHVGIDHLETALETTLETYDRIGVDTVVVPYLGEEAFASVTAVDETASRLLRLADAVAEYGFDLHYHNHAHEFTPIGDETAFDRLLSKTDERVGIELDVGWVGAAGHDPVTLLERLADRIDLVHMKDMDTSVDRGFVEIGDGDIDMQRCADAARDLGATWLIYEHDQPADPAASIDAGAAFLRNV